MPEAIANPPVKIVITEDMSLYRSGLRNALARYPDINIIGEAANGQLLLDLLETVRPDIITLNIQMPVLDGITVMPLLKQRYPEIKVLVISFVNNPEIIQKMMALGANGYISKESGSEDIYKGIITLRDNWIFVNDLLLDALDLLHTRKSEQALPVFTEKQLIILRLLQEGLPVNDIATAVNLDPRTVAAIIDKLKKITSTRTEEEFLAVDFSRFTVSGIP